MDCTATRAAHSPLLALVPALLLPDSYLAWLGFRVVGLFPLLWARYSAMIAPSPAPCLSFYCYALLCITTRMSLVTMSLLRFTPHHSFASRQLFVSPTTEFKLRYLNPLSWISKMIAVIDVRTPTGNIALQTYNCLAYVR